ncbi:leucine--tRNA ligase [Candidatus Jorgensenbacteria bacterium]|nr:leucine--tRNA ligase [Candidatus Jorgensenbacteria bacterium]
MKYKFRTIEKKWQQFWRIKKTYEPNFKKTKKPFYNLMMFPYPSAEGLHVGNMYAFVGSDIYGRMKRMQGRDVFQPIGLDGFGIHSENYALKIGAHPMKQAKVSEKRFYKQLEIIGNGFAWEERLETYDPEYYKWTQWIFIQMFKNGLAYRKKAPVNWCPSCKTVLADEQVVSGKCERCSSVVEKRELEQWFFKITAYAEKLLENLNIIDWSERVKIAQRNWIGRSEGASIEFEVKDTEYKIEVFTTRPDTLFGATYMVLAPEHSLIQKLKYRIKNWAEISSYIQKSKLESEEERINESKDKTGVELKGLRAVNPATGESIPIWIADYVLAGYGTGAIMAVPAHDERDFEFARKYNLPVRIVISDGTVVSPLVRAYTGTGKLVNSGSLDGTDFESAKWQITRKVSGRREIQYRLRDWLISRQRYWGAPIPMIYCAACAQLGKGEQIDSVQGGMLGWYAVPEKDLPVKLPFVKEFRPKGKGSSPLASVKNFYEVKCPKCGAKARRETDVSDTFLDSAWYYIGYLNLKKPFNKTTIKKWSPVNMYIGGAEHSVLHLLYSRFLAMAFHDMKLVDYDEPFTKFRAHGLLIKEGAKMSKSKGNVVNPDEYIKKFGADALRVYLMFLAPFEQGGDFRDASILGIVRFLDRAWRYFVSCRDKGRTGGKKNTIELQKLMHKTIKKVTDDIENLHYNTAISALMVLLNEFEKQTVVSVDYMRYFLLLSAPLAPYMTEELWHSFGNKTSIHREKWPSYNSKLVEDNEFDLIIQINGRVRDTVLVSKGIVQEEAEKIAREQIMIKKWLGTNAIKRVIFVKDRLINFLI